MATFRTGRKTDQTVLPQRPALESVPADNPGIRDETGHGCHTRVVPGTEHGREETTHASPGVGGVTPVPLGAGEKGREAHTTVHAAVFVLDKHGAPLQPTSPARARKLLTQRRAVVARHTPFIIRLKDRTAAQSEIDGVELGIDPGSKHTGIAVFTVVAGQRRGRYSIQLDHRGLQIRKKLQQRAAYRRRRRSVNLRYRAPRFNNRTRRDGWLAPSLQHRVDTTVSWADRLARWAPVRATHVEQAMFDVHAISAGKPLEGIEYQHGTLHGYEVREYLLAKWSRACAYCGATGAPLNIDHILPRSRGGSDRISNLVMACLPCNNTKANQFVEDFVTDARTLARIKDQVKAPLRDAAAINATRCALWRALNERLSTHVGTGGRTKWNRTRHQLPKSHTLDALAIGKLDIITATVRTVLLAGCTGRGKHQRTTSDKHGFPRLRLSRKKQFFGFATGDLVRAVVPTGKRRGTHTGRVLVRATGRFDITTTAGRQSGISHKRLRLLQRADGYAYTIQKETICAVAAA